MQINKTDIILILGCVSFFIVTGVFIFAYFQGVEIPTEFYATFVGAGLGEFILTAWIKTTKEKAQAEVDKMSITKGFDVGEKGDDK